MRARVADGLHGLTALQEEWEQLREAGGLGLFQSFAWMQAWAEVVAGRDDIRVLTIEDGRRRAIIPLIVRRRLGVRRLRWLGAEVTDYCDVIAAGFPADDLGMADLAACIAAHPPAADLVELRQIRAGSLASRLFDAAPSQPGAGAACPWIAVAGASPRRDILHAERRAAAAGALLHQVAADAAERADIVAFVIGHKRQALLRQGKTTAEFDRMVTPFLERLAGLKWPSGSLPYFSRLTLDGQTIAAQIGFIEGRTLFYYLPAFDFAFRRHSPGHLLLLNLVRDATRLGLEAIDLLRGEEPYKFKWTDAKLPLLAAEWTNTWRGHVFAFARRLSR